MYRYLIRSRHGRWTRRCDDCIALFILTVFCLAFAVLVWNALRIEPTGIIIAPVEAMERPHVPCHKVAPGHTVCGTPEDIAKWNAWLEGENAKTYRATVTMYSRRDSCHNMRGNICLTAIGRDTKEGTTVACPKHLPLGTRVRIEGIGERVCEDRYADWVQTRYGDTYDVFTEDYDEAIRFGRRTLSITIYETSDLTP